MLYTSSHLSLSVLEVFAHIPAHLRDNLPVLAAVGIGIPANPRSTRISADQFESLMANPDAVEACRAVGDAWLDRGRELLLIAPSILVPEDLNVMINPAHPDIRHVRVESTRPFRFDPRLACAR
jgi:RES domain-containing protein